MSRALVTAYAASLVRVVSWVIVLGVVYRTSGDDRALNLAVLAFARGTVGLLNYASLGMTPVLVRLLSHESHDPVARRRVYSSAGLLIAIAGSIGLACLLVYVGLLGHFHRITLPRPGDEAGVFLAVGVGTLLRTASDWFAAALLAGGRIVKDNACQIAADLAFVAAAALPWTANAAVNAAIGFAVSGGVLALVRGPAAGRIVTPALASVRRMMVFDIALLGGVVVVGQLADWMYAPLNQILIHHYLDPRLVGPYAVAIQIDAGLLLAVGGLSAVLLPAAAIAFREGRVAELRRRYVRSLVAGAGLLAAGATVVCLASRPIFELWFGNAMPEARAILPWVMVHTVIGGTATVGRSVLLGIGRVRAYTLSALAGGVANAALAAVLVTQTSLGLRAVVLATIVTVTFRCGVWMPWYTLRCLRPIPPSPI